MNKFQHAESLFQKFKIQVPGCFRIMLPIWYLDILHVLSLFLYTLSC